MAGEVEQLLDGFREAMAADTKALTLRDPIQAWLRNLDFAGSERHVSNPFKQAPHVYAAVTGVAEAVSSVGLQIQTLDNKPVEDHKDPSWQLLNRPNALQDRTGFFEASLVLLQLDGQVFWITLEPLSRQTETRRAVYIAQDSEMRPATAGGMLIGWHYRLGGAATEAFLPLDQVCRHYFFDPGNPLGGLSCIRAAQLSIDQHTFASQYNASVFQNGADPGSIYETDQRPTPEQVRQIEDKIRENHGGTANAKKPMVLWGGLKWKPGVQSLRDMDYIEGKKLTRDEILTVFKVPPVIAGIYETATLNNSREQVLLFWDHRGVPLLRKVILAGWNRFVQAQVDPSKELVENLSSIQALKEREIETLERILKFQDHMVPLNDLIAVYNLPIEPKPWGNVPLVQAGKLPIDVLFAEAAAGLAAENEPEGGTEEGIEGPAVVREITDMRTLADEGLTGIQTAVEQRAATDADTRKARQIHRRWLASYAGLRRVARMRVRAFVLRQRDETQRRLRKVGMPEGTEARRHEGAKGAIEEWLDKILFTIDVENGKLTVLGRFLMREGIGLGGAQAGKEAHVTEDWQFNLHAPAVRQRLERQAIRIRKVNNTTREMLRRTLVKGLDEGETLAEIGKRVAGAMNVRAGKQTYRIAETEMHEAVAAGRHEGFRQASVEAQAWLTSGRGVEPAGPTRKTHWGAEQATKAKPVKVGEPFTVGGYPCDYPGDGKLPPQERIYCSCMTVARRLKGGKMVTLSEYAAAAFVTYEQHKELEERATETEKHDAALAAA